MVHENIMPTTHFAFPLSTTNSIARSIEIRTLPSARDVQA
jgi:hypothetical protein